MVRWLVLLLLAGCGAGKPGAAVIAVPAAAVPATDRVPFGPDLRAAELRTLARTIAESYSHLAAKEAEWGFELAALTARYEPLVRAADTWKRYELAMVAFVCEFHDTHLSWRRSRGTSERKRRIARLGLSSRFLEEALVVNEVWVGSAAQRAGIRIGDQVVAIDGSGVEERFGQYAALRSWARLAAARHDFGKDWPASYYDAGSEPAERTLTLLREGARDTLRVAPETAPPPQRIRPPPLSFERRGEAVLLRVRSLRAPLDPGVLDTLAASLSDDPGPQAGGLVIDLRDDAGGYEDEARELVGRLAAHPVTGAQLRVRLNQRVRGEHAAWRQLDEDPAMPGWSPLQPVTAEPHAVRDYPGRIAVLVDAGCRSSCETLALLLRALGARLLGETTGGSSGAPVTYSMPWSRARVTVPAWEMLDLDGRPVEGRGVAPDDLTVPTRDDLAAGRDPVLERALEWVSVRGAG